MNLHEEIKKVAYELYEKSGRIWGRDIENWLAAEKIVKARHLQQERGVKAGSSAASSSHQRAAAKSKVQKSKTKETGPAETETGKTGAKKTGTRKTAKRAK